MSDSAVATNLGRPVAPSAGVLRPLGLDEVTITGGYWAHRQEVNAHASIEHIEHWMEKVGWIANFDAATSGRLPQDRTGREFSDSDVYKLLEAMAWEIGRSGDEEMDRRFNAIVARIAPVQEADGYLNTKFGRPGQEPRYSDLEWGHELYCFGHLIQAGIARARTGGDQQLMQIARRAADHGGEAFGPDGRDGVGGHPEIEVALAELARQTGERRYLDQAKLFIARRGHGRLHEIEFGAAYFQDDMPFLEATALRGHAVRALYLTAGAVDVALETGDEELLRAAIVQMNNTLARRTYLTGGMGSRHQDESFGLDFELPPDRAYSETCAGVGSVMVNFRLLLATGDERYADAIERSLFNVVSTSPASDGMSFFYSNTLHQRLPGKPPSLTSASPRATATLRAPWFEVSCCPTNVARTLASLATYMATVDDTGVQLHQYAPCEVRTALADDRRVVVRVETDYPEGGSIRVRIVEAPGGEWTLGLRVPMWAETDATVTTGAEVQRATPGRFSLTRRFEVGDVVTLTLPVEPRWTWPDPRIDAIRGTVAVEQGPLVLCLESVDLPGEAMPDDVRVVTDEPPRRDGPGGRTTVRGYLTRRDEQGGRDSGPAAQDGVDQGAAEQNGVGSGAWPYSSERPNEAVLGDLIEIPLIPYHDWANRGPSAMRVWLPVLQE